jgi:hypothetical protein
MGEHSGVSTEQYLLKQKQTYTTIENWVWVAQLSSQMPWTPESARLWLGLNDCTKDIYIIVEIPDKWEAISKKWGQGVIHLTRWAKMVARGEVHATATRVRWGMQGLWLTFRGEKVPVRVLLASLPRSSLSCGYLLP